MGLIILGDKKIIWQRSLFVILYLGSLFFYAPNIFAYNSQNAADYADQWAADDPESDKHNANYIYYPSVMSSLKCRIETR